MRSSSFAVALSLLACFALAAPPAPAQLGKLKDKVKKKAEEKLDSAAEDAMNAEGAEAAAEEAEGQAPPAAVAGSATAEDMALYTKYDFVPGDKVLFYDDLAREELGEFPSRWDLEYGVFEIAKQQGQNWILCTDKGIIRPRIEPGPLPERYTIEFDFYAKAGAPGHWYHIKWFDADNAEIGTLAFQDGRHTELRLQDKALSDKELPELISGGKHTMRIMATKSTLKCYIDQERVANVPAVKDFAPVMIGLLIDPWLEDASNPCLAGAFRFAEGGKTLREQLDAEGRIVTHGILFDSGSEKIKAESYKTLANIGELLTEDAALRLSIEGHTDADGADDYNMTLSQKRCDSVRAYLGEAYKIDAGRLETKGWGESQPIDTNDTPEGKANNRRVELVKL